MITVDHRPILAPLSPADRPPVGAGRLTLFGGGALASAAGPVSGRAAQRHRIALLALLASTRRLHRSRDQLIFFLWPDADAERGRKLLSDSIYRVNQALGGDAIIGGGEDVRLNRAQLGTDVADFEAAVDAQDWHRAAEVYSGPFLDGFFLPGSTDFDQWMEGERAHYGRLAARVLEASAIGACDAGRNAEAVEWWQRLVALVPDDSRVATMLMRALERAGNRPAALRHARQHIAYVRETLGVEPDRAVQLLADEMARESETPTDSTSSADGSSIAVLPFINLSDSEENCYFADGVSEELMYLLTRTPGVRVASRTSSFAYRDVKIDVREVGRRLDVDWILEGSVRRAGDTLRIAAQLTNARNGYQTWSESFERTSSDIFAIQGEIAGAIASRLAPAFGGRLRQSSFTAGRISDPDTYDLFLQARFHWHRRTGESLRRSARLFELVVSREPNSARAWHGLADSYAVIAFYDYMPPRVAFPRAHAAARKAIQLDASLAGPHATLGYVETYYHWNWVAAEQAFRRALELEPANSVAHQWYGTFLTARGRFAEAEREMRHAAELDPLSMIAHSGIGWVLALANDNDRAIHQLEHALQLDPTFCLANYWMALAFEQKDRPEEGTPFLEQSMKLSPNNSLVLAAYAHARASAGDIDAAQTILETLLSREESGEYISSYQVAKVHLALGDLSAALTRFERAYDDRAHDIALLPVDPQLRRLAGEPRFRVLVDRVNGASAIE